MSPYNSIFKSNLFEGKVALVTGGGTGIGRAIAHELASLGAMVIISARRKEVLENTTNEIKKNGFKAEYKTVNIRDSSEVESVVGSIVNEYGPIHLLVNNAGGQFLAPAGKISSNGFKTVVDLNLNGTWNVTRAVYHACMKEHGGAIVNITMDNFNGYPYFVHSGAARAGVENMTKTLSVEWGPKGIRMNSVAPGLILGSGMKTYPEEVRKSISQTSWRNPSGRFGSESEVASAVTYLLSPAASYINGATLRVDGTYVNGASKAYWEFGMFKEESRMPIYDGFSKHPTEDKYSFDDMESQLNIQNNKISSKL